MVSTVNDKSNEAIRRGHVQTSRAAIAHPRFLESITRLGGHDVVGLQKSGDIMFVDPDTRVKQRFVPASGMTIEIRHEQSDPPRVSDDGKTIIINRRLRQIPYIDDAVYAEYNETPTKELFDRDVIYVVERETFFELLATCALANQPLPATFAVPEQEVRDDSRQVIGYEHLVIYDLEGRIMPDHGSQIHPE